MTEIINSNYVSPPHKSVEIVYYVREHTNPIDYSTPIKFLKYIASRS